MTQEQKPTPGDTYKDSHSVSLRRIAEKTGRKTRTFFDTAYDYPAKGFLAEEDASSFVGAQKFQLHEEDVREEIAWARAEFAKDPDVSRFCSRLIEYLTDRFPGDADKWQSEFVKKGVDHKTRLPEVRREKCVSCFHRNVLFAYLLQQLGFKAKAIAGMWMETDQTEINVVGSRGITERAARGEKYTPIGRGMYVFEGETGGAHVFTLVGLGNDVYLADAALWVKDTDGKRLYPVVDKVDVQGLVKKGATYNDVSHKLPSGRIRHYVFVANDTDLVNALPLLKEEAT